MANQSARPPDLSAEREISQTRSSDAATEAFTEALIKDPSVYPELSLQAAFALSREQRDRIALSGMQRRFGSLRERIKILHRLAEEQRIDTIDTIDTGAYLLFPHTVYKSYPVSFLEQNRFDRLTRWLGGLCAVDLGGYSAEGVVTIDDWIDGIQSVTGIQLVHTSGTTGKLSFLPRSASDELPRLKIQVQSFRDWDGAGAGPDLLSAPFSCIYPSYRTGATAPLRSIGTIARYVARSEENLLTLYSERFSADFASLAGRLRIAGSRGEQGAIDLNPALLARLDEFRERERNRAGAMDRFFHEAQERFGGHDVVVLGVLPLIFDWAEDGLARGMEGLFGKNSIVSTGGGSKGRELPADAQARIARFLGFDRQVEVYAMSEMTGICRKCEHGHYHIPPYIVPFVLDPNTGAPQPREGAQTGRFGFVDLFPADHWGGFLSGDKVTVAGWDDPCACGRTGPYVDSPVHRFSEAQGGDDKITCAAAPAAQEQALSYLAGLAG
jgi:hypothetical protein